MKVLILGDENELTFRGAIPNLKVFGPNEIEVFEVKRVGKQVSDVSGQASCQVLIE